ncbi:MAG: metal-sulfur cluster assembly factor [Chloroflexota bacterium]
MTSANEDSYASRTDSVETKLTLLRAALAAGRYELAAALADSVKDGVQAERQLRAEPGQPVLSAGAARETASLPQPWREWARGWSAYQVLTLVETAGLDRQREPVDVLVSVPTGPTTRLAREARLARVDPTTGALVEVPSQIDDERRRGGERSGRLVFFASVPARGRETYLLFSGNPDASRPDYPSDLRIHGEGFGLDVENAHFIASLSRQMGQLERLTYKGGHGLELFAGGEGHGEPPNIDWAHDYLASGHFQKFRVTNWATCPSYEVTRGPLAVSVRRWGFPHGPVHPLFTPSRMHVDVTYTFYAGTPYFLKRGRLEMIQDFTLNYLRDDEWVFSGYSFTDALWLGEDGHLREGEVPAEHQDGLWGVGFFHRDSRHAFVALRLEHAASGFPGTLYHAGPPVLDYQGHGQLWSRWAARDDPYFPAGAVLTQRNAYLTSPYRADDGARAIEECYQRLQHPLPARAGEVPDLPIVASAGQLARPGEAGDSPISKQAIWDALRECRDEMLYRIDANVVDLGYIHDVRVQGDTVSVLMTMPHRGRPKYGYLGEPIRRRLLRVPGVAQVVVDLTWDPPWSANDLTERGARELGLP